MTAPDPAKSFAALLARVRERHDASPADLAHQDRPDDACALLWQLVFSVLAWEHAPSRAAAVNKRLHESAIDYNEMRVFLVGELEAVLGPKYPRAKERAARLRSVLNDVYRRHHAVTLEPLRTMNKREARAWLENLEGCPPFAASRVALLELDAHAFPIDERLRHALGAEHALPAGLSDAEASAWVERQLRAGEARDAYLMLEAWAAEHPPPAAAEKPAPKRRAAQAPSDRPRRRTARGA